MKHRYVAVGLLLFLTSCQEAPPDPNQLAGEYVLGAGNACDHRVSIFADGAFSYFWTYQQTANIEAGNYKIQAMPDSYNIAFLNTSLIIYQGDKKGNEVYFMAQEAIDLKKISSTPVHYTTEYLKKDCPNLSSK